LVVEPRGCITVSRPTLVFHLRDGEDGTGSHDNCVLVVFLWQRDPLLDSAPKRRQTVTL
jgi:hypothetical protein